MPARMRRWGLFAIGGLIVLAASVGCSLHWPLRPGDRAPELAVTEWLHGEPLAGWSTAGPITLVELWATWCGPCMGTVPYLDELQRRYDEAGVRVVAIAVQDDLDNVRDFVTARGGELGYAIAFDGNQSVWDEWRAHWFSRYLPCAFLVDQRGRIVSETHPAFVDDDVARMVAGEWPSTASQLVRGQWDDLDAARNRGDWDAVDALADTIIAASKSEAIGWTWKIMAQRDPAAIESVASQAIAATRGSALQLGFLVSALARHGKLAFCASAAHDALAAVTAPPPGLAFPCARVHAAQATGNAAALANVIGTLGACFADQPHELIAITRELLRATTSTASEPRKFASRATMQTAILPLVNAAEPELRTAGATAMRFEILIEIGTDSELIDAVGRTLVDRLRGRVTELNSLAWDLLTDPDRLDKARTVALAAARAMTETAGWETPNHFDTLALALFENGDTSAAIAAQERAIALQGDRVSESFRERLARYRSNR